MGRSQIWRAALSGAAFLGQGYALFYLYQRAFQLEPALWALAAFALLALLRPLQGLLYLPLTAPLAWRAKGVWDAEYGIPDGKYMPLHEIVLLVLVGVTLLYAVVSLLRKKTARPHVPRELLWPVLLWVTAATVSVLIASDAGRREALREWRWLIVEPLLAAVLVWRWGRTPGDRRLIAASWVAAGALTGLIGALQLRGYDLTPVEGVAPCHSPPVMEIEGVLRATSLYCHPNNLGLFVGRTWPLAVALGLAAWAGGRRLAAPVWLAGAGLALAGLFAAFSKGALAGAGVATIALAGLAARRRGAALAGSLVALLGVAALSGGPERLNPFGQSTSLRGDIRRSALAMLRDHPLLGVGLDQFRRFYNPEFGRSYIGGKALAAGEVHTSHPHNLILDLLLRTGVLGLLAYGWLTLLLARRCLAVWRSGGADRWLGLGVLAATGAALVHGMVDQGYFAFDLAHCFWAGLALAYASETSGASATTV